MALGKSKPGELTFASTASGHRPSQRRVVQSARRDKGSAVPYRVVGQAVDRFRCRPHCILDRADSRRCCRDVRQGQLKPLAVAGVQRSAISRHSDRPGNRHRQFRRVHDLCAVCAAWHAPEIVDWIHNQIGRALEDEAVQQKLRAAGVTPKIGAPERSRRCWSGRNPGMG